MMFATVYALTCVVCFVFFVLWLYEIKESEYWKSRYKESGDAHFQSKIALGILQEEHVQLQRKRDELSRRFDALSKRWLDVGNNFVEPFKD